MDSSGHFQARISLLLCVLFEAPPARAVPDSQVCFPALDVGLILYRFRALVKLTARDDAAVRQYLQYVMVPDRLAGYIFSVFPSSACWVYPTATCGIRPAGQPASCLPSLMEASLNPDRFAHG